MKKKRPNVHSLKAEDFSGRSEWITLNFSDFNAAYFGLNRLCLTDPERMIENVDSTQAILRPVIITCKSTKCDELNCAQFGLTAAKYSHLLRNYLPPNKVEELKVLGSKKKAHQATLDFNRKTTGTGNGSCLLELVISHVKKSMVWDTATIFYRVAEINCRWASDLIMIHRCLQLIPNSDFRRIHLVMPSSYQSETYGPSLVERYWGLSYKKLMETNGDNYHVRKMYENYCLYYRDHFDGLNERRLLSPGLSLRKAYAKYRRGEPIPMIGVEELSKLLK